MYSNNYTPWYPPPPNQRRPYVNRERQGGNRPATIAELAEKSRENLWDPNKDFRHWLRTAEAARRAGKQYAENGDYERGFIQLARAATIILEKMPTHREYHTLLNNEQRNNLTLVSTSPASSRLTLSLAAANRPCGSRLPSFPLPRYRTLTIS
jgi:hypothetical protein